MFNVIEVSNSIFVLMFHLIRFGLYQFKKLIGFSCLHDSIRVHIKHVTYFRKIFNNIM